jgi:putative membrane protein
MRLMRAERVRFPRRATWVTVVGLALVPLVIGGLLTWALWNPTQRLDRITAAVVNLDEPVKVDGQTVPLGRQLAAALVTGQASADPATTGSAATVGDPGSTGEGTTSDGASNVSGSNNPASFVWVLSDASDAAAGLADGRYGAVVTIPKDFSAAATSTAGNVADVTTATLGIATSPEARPMDGAIAQVIAQAAAGMVGNQLTQAYLDKVLVSFGTLHTSLGDASAGATKLADGATKLADGATGVKDGSSSLASGVGQVATGTSDLSTGLASLADGAGSLATGVTKVGSGASDLASGLDQLAAQTAQSASTAAAGVPGAQQFAAGLTALSDGVSAPGGLADSVTQLSAGAGQLSTGLTSLLTNLDGLAQACKAGTPGTCDQLIAMIQAQRNDPTYAGQPTITASAAQVAAGLSGLDVAISTSTDPANPPIAATLATLAAHGTELADGASQAATGLQTLASYLSQSAAGAHQLASGADSAATGADQLAVGARDASSGAQQLASGADKAATGADQLVGGADQLATGASDLATGATSLADGLDTAVGKLPSYSDSQASSLATVIASPVKLQGATTDLLGASTVPFLLAVALWLGGLATFLVLAPASREAFGSTRSSAQLALATFVPAAAVGAVQGVLLTASMAFALELSPGGWVALTSLAALTGVAFAAVNQALAALLGGVGRFVAMVVGVVALGTAVISTAPGVLTGVAALLPTAPALSAMRGVVLGTSGTAAGVVTLVLWAALGLAVTTLAIGRTRVVEVGRLTRWARAA